MREYKVSIVIPTYNTWKLTQGLLDTLSRHESENIDEVLGVDDGSSFDSVDAGLETDLPMSILHLAGNSGFPIACNSGLMQVSRGGFAEKKLIFLISNDVIITGKFIQQAADIAFGAKRVLIGNRHIGWDSGWNTFDGKTFDYLEGWFFAATGDTWRDLGYFDEAYSPYDYEDVDLATTAKAKGYKLVSLNNPHVIHLGGQTIGFNPERETVTRRNQEYFRKKWMK